MKKATAILVGIVENIERDIKTLDKSNADNVAIMKDRVGIATMGINVGRKNELNLEDFYIYDDLLLRVTLVGGQL